MSMLDSIGEGTLDGAITAIKTLKSGVDANVQVIRDSIGNFATLGLMAVFGLSMFVVVLTWVSVILNKLKPGYKILRLPFHASWLSGWVVGILYWILTLVIFLIAVMSVLGCGVLEKVTRDEKL